MLVFLRDFLLSCKNLTKISGTQRKLGNLLLSTSTHFVYFDVQDRIRNTSISNSEQLCSNFSSTFEISYSEKMIKVSGGETQGKTFSNLVETL